MRLNIFQLSQSSKNKGFALIAAVFLIVVVSLAVTYMQRLSSNQSNTSALSVQNARALQAAQAGLEWGVYRVWNNNGACPTSPTNLAIATNFFVQVTCATTNYMEAGLPVSLTTIDSSAQTIDNNFANPSLTNPDYVFKHVQATLEVGS